MTKVVVRNGNVESALRNLKVDKDGSRAQLRERSQGYLKPGAKRRKAKKEGIKNTNKREKSSKRDNY